MTPKVFFHKQDLDGHFSGLIAKYYFENVEKKKVDLIPFDYGMDLPKIGKEDLYFLDVTPSGYTILKELNENNNLVVIDHHKTFIDYIKKEEINIKGTQIEGVSGCELTWKYFFAERKVPEFITLLGRYDVWDNKNKDKWENEILPFQYGMRMKKTNPVDKETSDKFFSWIREYLKDEQDSEEVTNIIENGKVIISYQKNMNKNNINNFSFDIIFDGFKAICLNNLHYNSQVFESKWDPDKYDIMLNFALTKGKYYTVSLYTTKDNISCGEIAKKFGGGGHPQAAGFIAKSFLIKDEEIFFEIN